MDIIEIARSAGLVVLLDGKIGREEYHSVSGSLPALRRFGDAFRAAADAEARDRVERAAVQE
jgi:hypothetical protein